MMNNKRMEVNDRSSFLLALQSKDTRRQRRRGVLLQEANAISVMQRMAEVLCCLCKSVRRLRRLPRESTIPVAPIV